MVFQGYSKHGWSNLSQSLQCDLELSRSYVETAVFMVPRVGAGGDTPAASHASLFTFQGESLPLPSRVATSRILASIAALVVTLSKRILRCEMRSVRIRVLPSTMRRNSGRCF